MKTLLDEETSNQIQSLLSGQDKNLSFVDAKVRIFYFNIIFILKAILNIFFLKVEKDKNKRKVIHQFFKDHFGDKLNTETNNGVIRISMHTDKTRKGKY